MTPRSRRPTARQSKTFAVRKRERSTVIVGFIIVTSVVAVFGLSRLSMAPFLTISSVQILGADEDVAPALQAAAKQALSGSYAWGLFPKSSAMAYSQSSVTESVLAASPRVASVSVARSGLRGLAVTVRQKVPSAIVCASLPDLTALASVGSGDADQCYFADSTGLIFENAPSYSGDAYDRFYIPALSAGAAPVIGSQATSSEAFSDLHLFLAAVRQAGMRADGILLKEGGEYELYTRNPAVSGASDASADDAVVVYFNDSRPFSEELDNLLTFWKHAFDDAKAKKQILRFDYIDVRYGSNVFYRLIG